MTDAPDALFSGPQAFGVDPTRPEAYSLRQSRYAVLAQDISFWAGEAARSGRNLSLLDVGCGWGVLLRHLEAKPHFDALTISGTDRNPPLYRYKPEFFQEFFVGDLTGGYPEIASDRYDIVVCEQVLEHLDDLAAAVGTLARLVRPGGKLIIGAPIFPPPLHLARKYIVPPLARLLRHPDSASHIQAFSLYSLLRVLRADRRLKVLTARGFRIVSGGLLRRLENYRWWWRLNCKIGEVFPALCIEVQVILEKSAAS